MLAKKTKQPADVKPYPIDYGDWLAELDDTIASVDVAITCLSHPGDTALLNTSTTQSSTGVVVWLAGGTHKRNYKVTVTVTTASGAVDEADFEMLVKDN